MNVPPYVSGAIAPVFTIFQDGGALDADGQRRFLDFLYERGGISAFFLRSGMGQMYAYEYGDVKQIAQTAPAHLAGKAPVLIGCSGIWDRNYDRLPDPAVYARQAVEFSGIALDAGAAGVVHTIPECLPAAPGQDTGDLVVDYFEKLCGQIAGPVLLYQPPKTRKEFLVTAGALSRLADIGNLVALKASTTDGHYLFQLARAVERKEFKLILGAETAYYAVMSLGIDACIGQGTTLNPRLINTVADCYRAGDMPGMLAAQADVNRLVEECPNAVDFFKRYAGEQGYPVGLYARPVGDNPYMEDRPPMDDAGYAAFRRLYEETTARYE